MPRPPVRTVKELREDGDTASYARKEDPKTAKAFGKANSFRTTAALVATTTAVGEFIREMCIWAATLR